jgi:hypothetical protein
MRSRLKVTTIGATASFVAARVGGGQRNQREIDRARVPCRTKGCLAIATGHPC